MVENKGLKDSQKFIENSDKYYGSFSNYSRVYDFTTENIKESIGWYNSSDRILTVLSSGDHVFDYLLRGASDIESFDVNVITKYFFNLKRALIENMNFSDFESIIDNLLPFALHNLESFSLDPDIYAFWDFYRRNKEPKMYNKAIIGVYPKGSKQYNIYFDKENYQRLKSILKSGITIPFHNADVLKLSHSIKGKLKEINLSSIYSLVSKKNVPKVVRRLNPFLEDEGKILFYSFGREENETYLKYGLSGRSINGKDAIYTYQKKK